MTLKKVQPGDKWQPSASHYNAVVDLYNAHARGKLDGKSGGKSGSAGGHHQD